MNFFEYSFVLLYKGGDYLNQELKESIQSFSDWLDSIPPYEFSLYASLVAYLIAPTLSISSQNALGNWFEQLGQILLTISAQASATPSNEEYKHLVNKVKQLENELKDLKSKL